VEKEITLHDGNGLFLVIKSLVKNYGAFVICALLQKNAR